MRRTPHHLTGHLAGYLAAAVLAGCCLAGCVAHPVVTPAPTPSGTPIFASDDDALKAATDAYAEYLKVAQAILRDGGVDADRIDVVATTSWAAEQKQGFASNASKGLTSQGEMVFDGSTLESYYAGDPTGVDIVTIYACLDLTSVDVVDGTGHSVVSPSRPDRQPFEVHFDWSNKGKRLLVAEEDPWSGAGIC